MTPTSPSSSPGKRQSGNPATQKRIELTVKQQRERQKQEKLAEYQRQLAKRRRGKLTWWIVGSAAAITVIALVVASVVLTPKAVTYEAGGTGAQIDGVSTFTNETNHVQGTVDYAQTPPAGGPHNQYWLNCGVYSEPQQNENAVHSLEHGAVWVTYDAAQISGADLDALRAQMPSTYTLLTPYEGLPSPIVLSAWNAQLQIDSPSDPRIGEFFEEYWRNQNVPEPTAVCSGAIDGPGKQS